MRKDVEKKFKLERLEHESLETVIDLLLVNENASAFFLAFLLSCNILQINWSISKDRQTENTSKLYQSLLDCEK